MWRFRVFFFFVFALEIISLASTLGTFFFCITKHTYFSHSLHWWLHKMCKKNSIEKNVWTNLKPLFSWQYQRATSCCGLSKWKHTNILTKRQTVSSNINIWMTTNQKKSIQTCTKQFRVNWTKKKQIFNKKIFFLFLEKWRKTSVSYEWYFRDKIVILTIQFDGIGVIWTKCSGWILRINCWFVAKTVELLLIEKLNKKHLIHG